MLVQFRRLAKSLIAKILLVGLVASFAVWGIGDLFIYRTVDSVFVVGESKVSLQAFANAFRQRMDVLSGEEGGMSLATARELQLDRQVLRELAIRATLEEEARAIGLSASDRQVTQAIISLPAFQNPSGQFDRTAYEIFLRRSGYTPRQFEAAMRAEIAADQLAEAVGMGLAPARAAARRIAEAFAERRSAAWIVVTPQDMPDPAEPTAADIETFFEAARTHYMAPEYRDFSWAIIEIAPLIEPENVSDEAIEALYRDRLAFYSIEAWRKVSRLLYDTQEQASAAKAQWERDRDFPALARARGVSRADYDLGLVKKGELPPDLETALFALGAPGIAGPLETPFGWALFEVSAMQDAFVTPLEAVREQLRDELAREQAIDRLPDLVAQIEDAIAGGATLAMVARDFGIAAGQTGFIDKAGLDTDGLRADNPLTQEMRDFGFTRVEDEEAAIRETADGGRYLIRLEAVRPPVPRPLEAVRARVEAEWRAQRKRMQATERIAALAAQVNAGEALAGVAQANGLTLSTAEPQRREDMQHLFPPATIDALFAAEPGVAHALTDGGGNPMLIMVRQIAAPSEDDAALSDEIETLAQRIAEGRAEDMRLAFVNAMLERHEGRYFQEAIDSALDSVR